MIFGNPAVLAFDAQLEPDVLPVVGANVAGRIRCYVAGEPFGKWDEPYCIFGEVTGHLNELAWLTEGLWHSDLQELTLQDRFRTLDETFYLGFRKPHLTFEAALCSTNFLTNVSEAFDSSKSFMLAKSNKEFQILVECEGGFLHTDIPRSDFLVMVEEFSKWLALQELRFLGSDA